jgi:hypothetical protein
MRTFYVRFEGIAGTGRFVRRTVINNNHLKRKIPECAQLETFHSFKQFRHLLRALIMTEISMMANYTNALPNNY